MVEIEEEDGASPAPTKQPVAQAPPEPAPASEGTASSSGASAVSLRPGLFARLQGIQSQKQLNDEVCEIVRPADKPGRWIVLTRYGEKSVKEENLLVAADRLSAKQQQLIRAAGALTAVLAGLAARNRGRSAVVASLVPLCAFLWLLGTLGVCYYLSAPLRAPGLAVPTISEMGVAPPGRGAYRAGFMVVGIFFAGTIWHYGAIVVPRLAPPSESDDPGLPGRSINYGYLAAFGAALQGILTLEMQLSVKSILHFLGAIIFIFGTMQHASMSTALLFGPRGQHLLESSELLLRAATVRKACSEYGPLLLMVVPLAQQVFKRVPGFGSLVGAKSANVEDAMGALQWALVLNFAFFFTAYAGDFFALAGGLSSEPPTTADM